MPSPLLKITDRFWDYEYGDINRSFLIQFQWVSLVRLWACSQLYPPSPSDQLSPWFLTAARTGTSEHSLGTSGAPQQSSEAATDAPSTAGDTPCGNFWHHTVQNEWRFFSTHHRLHIWVSERGAWIWMLIGILLWNFPLSFTSTTQWNFRQQEHRLLKRASSQVGGASREHYTLKHSII